MDTSYEADLSAQQLEAQAQARFPRAHVNQSRTAGSIPQAGEKAQEAVGVSSDGESRFRLHTIKKRPDFLNIQSGPKWAANSFVMQGRPRTAEQEQMLGHVGNLPRFGFTVSSKSVAKQGDGGKMRGKAVDRNRVKRRLKEAVRLTAPGLAKPGYDYVLIGRAGALTQNFASLLADMRLAFHKIGQKPYSRTKRPLKT
jgi:ribonuclease P protein component